MSGKIIIFGDICPDNNYRKIFDKGSCALSENILAEIKKAEYVVANLECPATNETNPIVKCGPNLRAKPGDLQVLSKAGINVLSLANNHILDYGVDAVSDTLKACHDNGFFVFGAGKNQSEAEKPLIIEISGKKVGFISFAEEEFNIAGQTTPGSALFDPYYSFDKITALKKDVDIVVVLYHGGIEHYVYPTPLLQKKCRKMVEVGADLVLCQHSHCIGTIETYHEKTILYGQGNSVFGYREGNEKWNEGLLVELDAFSSNTTFKLMKATPEGIVFADTKDEDARIDLMRKQSEILDDVTAIKDSWTTFVEENKALYYSMLLGKNRVFNKMNRILKNKLIDIIYRKMKQMITMNILRCDAHREVLITMLEEKVYGK
ncbi:poly-gamma-glutamate synthesis protein (capsule biosynthesis protein) [Faecalimonas umbilicata]|uniref:Poly-gamma-glutamate synthesis protein (Capsule biosynthesis protein) n=1 Tax=Faecalimonas umbilicata TaxID=1912855 RepID=A0A4R3JRF4_9FIRM|nr:CapA family protein [Faecalimonas umbilicata]TCS69651.1 poly-gamma-glutamate synthesis protein (capsule biosynthesis protein) [Faecalimonas umbilicata]GBU05934.1 hypothetical protein FAEUMB_24750 [Faecalimonas umbilicata]